MGQSLGYCLKEMLRLFSLILLQTIVLDTDRITFPPKGKWLGIKLIIIGLEQFHCMIVDVKYRYMRTLCFFTDVLSEGTASIMKYLCKGKWNLIRLTSLLAHPDKFCLLSTNIKYRKKKCFRIHFFTIVAATMFPWLANEETSCLARCALSKYDSCSNIAAFFSQSFVHGIFLILDKAHSLNIQYFCLSLFH